MATKKQKWYVVWAGRVPGVYTTWEETLQQVQGAAGAVYKGFESREEAYTAYERDASLYVKGKTAQKAGAGGTVVSDAKPRTKIAPKVAVGSSKRSGGLVNPPDDRHDTVLPLPAEVVAEAWAVDAACSGNPGQMEYRGVCLRTGAEVFHLGPVLGTNNIGEFLAIVHALALLEKQGGGEGMPRQIYSDSRNAISWIKQKKCKTTLEHTARTAPVHDLIARAERWLQTHTFRLPIVKWETRHWGEVPADFGRK